MATTRRRGRPRCRTENQGLTITVTKTQYEGIRAAADAEGLAIAAWTRRLIVLELRRLGQEMAAA